MILALHASVSPSVKGEQCQTYPIRSFYKDEMRECVSCSSQCLEQRNHSIRSTCYHLAIIIITITNSSFHLNPLIHFLMLIHIFIILPREPEDIHSFCLQAEVKEGNKAGTPFPTLAHQNSCLVSWGPPSWNCDSRTRVVGAKAEILRIRAMSSHIY